MNHSYAIFMIGGALGMFAPRLGMIYFLILGACGITGMLS